MKTTPTEVITPERPREGRGRRRRTEERRNELIAAYHTSGLTQVAFAKRAGIKYSTFTGWLQGRRRATPVRVAPVPLRFLEASAPPGWRGVEVTLPDGTRLRAGTAGELAELLGTLRG